MQTATIASSPRPVGFHLAALIDELDTECRLLGDLRRVLVSQRDGISKNDLGTIDESTFSAQRILLTLQQARQRRRNLLELLEVDQGAELADLEDALGPLMTPELTGSRDALLQAAAGLQRELTVNRRVIDGALDMGDRLLRIFTGQTERAPTYTAAPNAERSGSSGALLNTRA